MWNRFKRWLRSALGGFLESAEDPEKILNQNIKDMNDQIPIMNQNIATIRKNELLLNDQKQRLARRQEDLKGKIKAALQTGRRDLALQFASQLEQAATDIAETEKQCDLSRQAVEKAEKVKAAFIAEKEKRIREVQAALAKAQQAQWQRKVADAMESFEIAGISHTHEEMIRKIEERAADSQARMEMALSAVDAEGFNLDKEAEKIRAEELVKQFEMELGMTADFQPISDAPQKTLGAAEPIEEAARSTLTNAESTKEKS